MNPSFQDKAYGMLLGTALGDALGMPTEFLTSAQIKAWYGEISDLTKAHPNHPHHNLPLGSVTDDTDHTLILANLILQDGGIELRAFAEALLAWGESERVQKNRFVGPSTLHSLQALKDGQPLESVPRKGTSVGAAMRTASLALAFAKEADLETQVVNSCKITHFTQNAISGAMSMAFGLAACLQPDASVESVVTQMKRGAVKGREYGEWSWSPAIEERINLGLNWAKTHTTAETLHFLTYGIGTDYNPQDLVPCSAVLLQLCAGDGMQAIRWAANMGGDTDTLASMTGSLCGGLYGAACFDEEAAKMVEEVNHLELHLLSQQLLSFREEKSRASHE